MKLQIAFTKIKILKRLNSRRKFSEKANENILSL